MVDMKDRLESVNKTLKSLAKKHPKAMQGFNKYMGETKKDGVLSQKFKELIGVALSVVQQCEFCVALHVHNAMEAGASEEEIVEASMMAGVMSGGPGIMFTKYVFDAIEDFKK